MRSDWYKSSKSPSGDNSCVETKFDGGKVHVRNSNDPTGPVVEFTPNEWTAFVGGVKDSEFDL